MGQEEMSVTGGRCSESIKAAIRSADVPKRSERRTVRQGGDPLKGMPQMKACVPLVLCVATLFSAPSVADQSNHSHHHQSNQEQRS
jgi:hypothetical protein